MACRSFVLAKIHTRDAVLSTIIVVSYLTLAIASTSSQRQTSPIVNFIEQPHPVQ
jgi:hypothetical protein